MSRFQILALDGGGIRGLYSAAVLAKLEEKHNTRITDHFDLIAGTSTGGIIALGLGLGLRPREIVRFYSHEGPKIFGNPMGLRWLLHWFGRKYPHGPLHGALNGAGAFGDKKLGESRHRLVIPAYNLGQDKVRLFKTPHHADLTTDRHIPMWKIAMATSAAPTFFPVFRGEAQQRLIDGGVWANNPAVVGIAEAVGFLGCSLNDIHVLSLGTTDARARRGSMLNWGGKLPWVFKSDAIDILMRGQSVGTNGLVRHLIGKDNFLRVDAQVPKTMALDKLQEDELLAEAEDTALHTGPQIRNRFFQHRAEAYTPTIPHEGSNA